MSIVPMECNNSIKVDKTLWFTRVFVVFVLGRAC